MKRWQALALITGGIAMVVVIGLDVLAFFSGAEHHGGFWNSAPLGDLALGALGAGLLIWFARGVLKRLLTRPEHYYRGARRS